MDATEHTSEHAPDNAPNNTADRLLLADAARGVAGAFDALVVRHADALHRFGWSLGVRPPDLDDVLQDSFVSAWRTASGYRGDGTVRSWLFGILRNRVRTLHRAHRTDIIRSSRSNSHESVEDMACRAGWGSPDGGPAADAHDLIHRALERLTIDDREVLVLRHLLELPGEETAQTLDLSLAAMKSRLHRARLHLAAEVRELDANISSRAPDTDHAQS